MLLMIGLMTRRSARRCRTSRAVASNGRPWRSARLRAISQCHFCSGGKSSIKLNHSTRLTRDSAHVPHPLRQFQITICSFPFHFRPQMPRSENPFTPRTRRLSANARRALEMLAAGFATEKIMADQGFTRRLLIGLLRTKLATRYSAPLEVGNRTVEVTYIKITDAGRRALEG
jgi:hypothetical protein